MTPAMKLMLVPLVFFASACQESSRNTPAVSQEQTTLKDRLTQPLAGFWSGTSDSGYSNSKKCYWYLDLKPSGYFELSISYSETAKQDHLAGTWDASDQMLHLLPSNPGTYLFPIPITDEDREQGIYTGYPATIREIEGDQAELYFHCVDWNGGDHLLLAHRVKLQESAAGASH